MTKRRSRHPQWQETTGDDHRRPEPPLAMILRSPSQSHQLHDAGAHGVVTPQAGSPC